MNIFIKTLSSAPDDLGTSILVETSNPTGLDLKEAVSKQLSISLDSIKLLYNAKKLKDDDKLSTKNVTDGCSVIMLQSRSKPKLNKQVTQELNVDKDTQAAMFKTVMQNNPTEFINALMNDPIVSKMAGNNKEEFVKMLEDPDFLQKVIDTGSKNPPNNI